MNEMQILWQMKANYWLWTVDHKTNPPPHMPTREEAPVEVFIAEVGAAAYRVDSVVLQGGGTDKGSVARNQVLLGNAHGALDLHAPALPGDRQVAHAIRHAGEVGACLAVAL